MVVDYERAWVRLQALIASKSQHGREGMLQAMAEIAEECRVPPGELSRLLRLYGVEVERARSIATEIGRAESAGFADGSVSSGDGDLPEHDRPLGGHHVGRNGAGRAH